MFFRITEVKVLFFFRINSILSKFTFLLRAFVRLQITSQRICEAAAYTARSAGYFRLCSHDTFCGVTAAVASNRTLSAGILFVIILHIHTLTSHFQASVPSQNTRIPTTNTGFLQLGISHCIFV